MLVLGLETSCDETAASLVEGGTTVRSNVVSSQIDLHTEYGGVVPEIASRAHVERLLPVVRAALRDASCDWSDIDAIAVGHRPGLIGSLLVGVAGAKALAWSLDRPLVGVDHVHAHLHAALLERDPPPFPAIGLVVSGGHTTLLGMTSIISLERLGSTIDDAVGEAYDKAATILGLPYPGGPALDALARTGDDRAHEFPVSRLGRESLDFSFSGLKTAMLYAVQGVPGRDEPRTVSDLDATRRADLAAGFQRAAVKAIMLKLGRAVEGRPCRSIIVGGGVSANSLLRASLESFATSRDLELAMPEMTYCVDNAAMIAGLGHHLLDAGERADLTLTPVPTTGC